MYKRDKPSLWSQVKEVLNQYEKDEEFTRVDFRAKLDNPVGGSLDIYRQTLTSIGVLEWVKRGVYRKKCNIPEGLTTTKMERLRIDLRWNKNWRDWFMELPDRLERLANE